MDNQPEEFQDSTSNLTNTETELNSTQQGSSQLSSNWLDLQK